MNDAERAALDLAAQLLAGHHCDRCGKEWITGRSQKYIAHKCASPTPSYDWRPPRERHDDERRAWAERQLGASKVTEAIETAVGDRAWLPVEGDES